MAIIRIKNLRVSTIIGFNPEERDTPQEVVINIEIEVDVSEAVKNDDPGSIYDYKKIKKSVITFTEQSHFHLLEKLTAEILNLVMADPEVIRAKVEIDKPYALRHADSVSVEMEARR